MPRLAGVTAALNQGLQVGYNEAQRVQDDPGHDDALQPAGSFLREIMRISSAMAATVTATMVLMATT